MKLLCIFFKLLEHFDCRVDGVPLFYGINDTPNNGGHPNNNGCPGCPCGPYSDQPNDILALCSAMLLSSGVKRKLESAYVSMPHYFDSLPQSKSSYDPFTFWSCPHSRHSNCLWLPALRFEVTLNGSMWKVHNLI